MLLIYIVTSLDLNVKALNSLNGVIAYATEMTSELIELTSMLDSQFPERSYSLCYEGVVKREKLQEEKSLNSLNGVIAYATSCALSLCP